MKNFYRDILSGNINEYFDPNNYKGLEQMRKNFLKDEPSDKEIAKVAKRIDMLCGMLSDNIDELDHHKVKSVISDVLYTLFAGIIMVLCLLYLGIPNRFVAYITCVVTVVTFSSMRVLTFRQIAHLEWKKSYLIEARRSLLNDKAFYDDVIDLSLLGFGKWRNTTTTS